MAHITNQWLKGDAERSRIHSPIRVTIEVRRTLDEWSLKNSVVADLHISKSSGDYQCLSLTHDDLETALPLLVSLSRPTTQSKIALEILRGLADKRLLELLSKALSSREEEKVVEEQ